MQLHRENSTPPILSRKKVTKRDLLTYSDASRAALVFECYSYRIARGNANDAHFWSSRRNEERTFTPFGLTYQRALFPVTCNHVFGLSKRPKSLGRPVMDRKFEFLFTPHSKEVICGHFQSSFFQSWEKTVSEIRPKRWNMPEIISSRKHTRHRLINLVLRVKRRTYYTAILAIFWFYSRWIL